jgi:poly(3-hydroxyalkanoate) depolymerase
MTKIETRTIEVDGQSLQVRIQRGQGVPILLFNGIGANLELLEPLMHALDGMETIVFDVPGVGGSAKLRFPYRMRRLARLADRLLDALGYAGQVDALGVSWGGALAQQFARSFPHRCRRLVLAATTPGMLMMPGSPLVLAKLLAPKRYADPSYLKEIAPAIYGGEVRRNPDLIESYVSRLKPPHWLGYLYQQIAFWGWSSLPWLPRLRQPTLVLGARDDPLAPLANSRVLAKLIPGARLHIVDDGHLFVMTGAHSVAPVIRDFLLAPAQST